MTEIKSRILPKKDEGSRTYLLFSVVALLVILLGLIQRGNMVWTVVLLLVSAAAVAACWRTGPVLLLLGLVLALVSLPWNSWQFWAAAESDPLGDLILAGGALGFIAAHYRFQGLVHHIVPPDGRARSSDTKKGKKDGAVSESWPVRRSDRLVDSREVATLLLSLPIWAALGLAAFLLLPGSWTGLGIDPRGERLILVVWVLGVGGLVAGSLFGYLGRRRAALEEATMPMQELLWKETRSEQRTINRWLTWGNLRRNWRTR